MTETSVTPLKSRNEWRYNRVEGHWDEATRPSGFPRRHWRKLFIAIRRMELQELDRCWQIGQQLIQANSVSFNTGNHPYSEERLWRMDPIPLLISESEWEKIERAIIQRATLLNALLIDLYGEQRLLYERRFPPALLFANPDFLRPCHGITPAGGVFLHSCAADLARSPDGTWWVLSDRTQTPAGLGYALENRLVSARTFPKVFSQCRVRQLTRFCEARRDALLRLAERSRAHPRIVLLTPGPHNATYFEHALLAAEWGFPLVEGPDLSVRDNRVYVKTVAGLEPVDLIVRWLVDSLCDPLELRGDSVQGVPGLVQAVRSGGVTIVNALGSGLVETPAQMAFLPGLCRHLLGQELHMPSVATWWCGQEEPLRYVLRNLDQLVIRPAYPQVSQRAEFPGSMDVAAREKLIRRIEAHPERFVAQERVALSTAPTRTESGFAPRYITLRVFVTWDGRSYTVFPGGLTCVSTEDTSPVVPIQLGEGSKDTWALGGAGEAPAIPRPEVVPLDAPPVRANLPSRVAENLFWLGRYSERVEARVRLVRALLPALSGEEDFGHLVSLETVVHLLVGLGFLPAEVFSASLGEQLWRIKRLLADMVYDRTRFSGLGWNLRQMRRAAWHLKERLSIDTWRVLQQIESDFARMVPVSQRSGAEINLLDSAIVTLSALAGLLMENTTRGHAWRFVDIGRRLERAVQMAELLRAGMSEVHDGIEPRLRMLLHIADSAITYRTRYLTVLRTDLVLDLLLADESNPRSIEFQLAALFDHIEKLPDPKYAGRRPLEQRLALKSLTAVRLAQAADLSRRDEDGRYSRLVNLLQQLRADMYDLSEALTAHYLSHVTPTRLTSS